MVAIEAAAHGLPTVAFAAGGVPDAVAPGISGWLASPDDYATFADRVCQVLDAGKSTIRPEDCRGFAAEFAWPVFGARLRSQLGLPGVQPEVPEDHEKSTRT